MSDGPSTSTTATLLFRAFAWAVVAVTFVFLLNNYLTFWRGWPGAGSVPWGTGGDQTVLGLVQLGLYALCAVLPLFFVWRSKERSLRTDSAAMTAIVTYIVRAAFWSVLFVGLADMLVSFLRVEGYLEQFVGAKMATKLGLSKFRSPYVHAPLIVLGLLVAAVTRTLGFTWLTLLVVIAELQIVLSRFIFSYEQAFMGDLVRFWYAALFLFASAYTLLEEGHVRVDVLYAGFARKTKGAVNAVGSLVLGILFCWVVLYLGMEGKSSIINAPLISLEVSQSGFGMYVKYLMAGFLAVFAVTMMIQFASYLLESVADYRGDPGGRLQDDDDPITQAAGGH